MSHDHGWRAACIVTLWIPKFQSEMGEVARGVTAMVVGSGALLGLWLVFLKRSVRTGSLDQVLALETNQNLLILFFQLPVIKAVRKLPWYCYDGFRPPTVKRRDDDLANQMLSGADDENTRS